MTGRSWERSSFGQGSEAHSGAIYCRGMKRRLVSISAVMIVAIVLLLGAPVWLVIGAVVDLVRGRPRLPVVRLLAFALLWSWLETVGVVASALLWILGRSADHHRHYALQRWWARNLLRALRVTCGLRITVENPEALHPGPVVMFARHASLADSLVSAYVVTTVADMKPRYVLKKELLADPCLDVVGQRLANHFLDRGATDSTPELQALSTLTSTMDERTVGIIFPEGTRANPAKRAKAIARISEVDPERVGRVSSMRHLLPPRPAGAAAMLRGHSTCDVVVAWHVGFEGLDTFGGILAALSDPIPPIRFVLRRIPRSDVPSSYGDFTAWLDGEWMRMDDEVDTALLARRDERR